MKTIKSKRRLSLEAAFARASKRAKRNGEFKDWERFRRIGRALCDEISADQPVNRSTEQPKRAR